MGLFDGDYKMSGVERVEADRSRAVDEAYATGPSPVGKDRQEEPFAEIDADEFEARIEAEFVGLRDALGDDILNQRVCCDGNSGPPTYCGCRGETVRDALAYFEKRLNGRSAPAATTSPGVPPSPEKDENLEARILKLIERETERYTREIETSELWPGNDPNLDWEHVRVPHLRAAGDAMSRVYVLREALATNQTQAEPDGEAPNPESSGFAVGLGEGEGRGSVSVYGCPPVGPDVPEIAVGDHVEGVWEDDDGKGRTFSGVVRKIRLGAHRQWYVLVEYVDEDGAAEWWRVTEVTVVGSGLVTVDRADLEAMLPAPDEPITAQERVIADRLRAAISDRRDG